MPNTLLTSTPVRVIGNWAALLLMLAMNILANALPLGGRTTAAISDSFPILFVPAGYVFAIWGLIYAALLAFAIFQSFPAGRDHPAVRTIGGWFALSCLANAAWVPAWHFGYFPATLVLTVALLACLIIIVRRHHRLPAVDPQVRRWVVIPFQLYLGWATVATVANASVVLWGLGWNGTPFSPVTWTVLLILVAASLAIVMQVKHRDPWYGGVILWALLGILIKQSAYPAIVTASGVAIGLILLAPRAWQRWTATATREVRP